MLTVSPRAVGVAELFLALMTAYGAGPWSVMRGVSPGMIHSPRLGAFAAPIAKDIVLEFIERNRLKRRMFFVVCRTLRQGLLTYMRRVNFTSRLQATEEDLAEDCEPCIPSSFGLPRTIFVAKNLLGGRRHKLALQPILIALNVGCAAHRSPLPRVRLYQGYVSIIPILYIAVIIR